MRELKLSFINKLNLAKSSRFLSKHVLLSLYFKVILPSISYGLVVWDGCNNRENLNSLERLNCRAARLIFGLPRDIPSENVFRAVGWKTLHHYYKTSLIKLIFKLGVTIARKWLPICTMYMQDVLQPKSSFSLHVQYDCLTHCSTSITSYNCILHLIL
jgi:hypothetical protein